jgi:hypothetical protein
VSTCGWCRRSIVAAACDNTAVDTVDEPWRPPGSSGATWVLEQGAADGNPDGLQDQAIRRSVGAGDGGFVEGSPYPKSS